LSALRTVLAALAPLVLVACGAGIVRNPVPPEAVETVRPLGLPGLREWGDVVARREIDEIVADHTAKLRALYARDLAAGRTPVLDYLAISGGGQWGAFSAGILKAWTESGTRPEFLMVSGVSTGAIIAPLAFLGPKYDAMLEEVYTSLSTKDVLETTIFLGITSGTALADTNLLAALLAKYYTPEVLAAIAVEHRRGRRLLVGTTNIDASRPVIWDLGAIAASGHPDALALFHKVILGSAAIPVAFPPAFIEVMTEDGRIFDEMHVDGGATNQVTLASPQLANVLASHAFLARRFHRRLWVLMNNDVLPAYAATEPRITGIGSKAISSLIRAGGIGDLYKLYVIAERGRAEFRAGWIPGNLPCTPTETFDPAFMKCLFGIGEGLFRDNRLWHDTPPFFEETVPASVPAVTRSNFPVETGQLN
jgi:hypothetical protein